MSKQVKKRVKYNNVILIPTDFSEVCGYAIQHGIELAQFLNYKVCILHVINEQGDTVHEDGETDLEQIEMKMRQYKDLYEKKYTIDVDLLIKEGNILKVINKAATEIKANLMVLGTHGKQGLQHLFGSHALKLVLDSPCPVVVVQERSFKNGYQNTMLPISSDIEPRQSIEWVLLMSRLFSSKIRLFQSLETDVALASRLKIIIHQITKIFDEKKIPYDIKTAGSARDFSTQVVADAVAHQSDLIMIMTMPGEEVPGFNFSAWNERLMFNEARIPVMCVNPIELGDFYYEWMM